MVLFYLDFDLQEGKLRLFSTPMKDRHKIWLSNPKAKEITQKEYLKMREIIDKNKKDETNREQNNP